MDHGAAVSNHVLSERQRAVMKKACKILRAEVKKVENATDAETLEEALESLKAGSQEILNTVRLARATGRV